MTKITEEDIKRASELLGPDPAPKGPRKQIWLIDCFKYIVKPEDCDPSGCGVCNHFKELEKKYR